MRRRTEGANCTPQPPSIEEYQARSREVGCGGTAADTLTIEVMNDLARPALSDSHLKRAENKRPAEVIGHPATRRPRDHGKVKEAGRGRDEGDVPDVSALGRAETTVAPSSHTRTAQPK